MNKKRASIVAAVLVAVVVGLVVLELATREEQLVVPLPDPSRIPPAVAPEPAPPPPPAPKRGLVTKLLVPEPAPEPAPVPPPEPAPAPPLVERPTDPVRVEPQQVLALVNNVELKASDVIPIPADREEQVVSPTQYEALLNRAIERELTQQAAVKAEIELNEKDQRVLEEYRAEMESDQGIAGTNEVVLAKLEGFNPESIEWRLKESASAMLQSKLMWERGFSQHVTPYQVEQYYEANRDRYGELPSDEAAREEAWRKIDYQIRKDIYLEVKVDYEKERQAYLDELKRSASITVY